MFHSSGLANGTELLQAGTDLDEEVAGENGKVDHLFTILPPPHSIHRRHEGLNAPASQLVAGRELMPRPCVARIPCRMFGHHFLGSGKARKTQQRDIPDYSGHRYRKDRYIPPADQIWALHRDNLYKSNLRRSDKRYSDYIGLSLES